MQAQITATNTPTTEIGFCIDYEFYLCRKQTVAAVSFGPVADIGLRICEVDFP
jgi:hypothetical protein